MTLPSNQCWAYIRPIISWTFIYDLCFLSPFWRCGPHTMLCEWEPRQLDGGSYTDIPISILTVFSKVGGVQEYPLIIVPNKHARLCPKITHLGDSIIISFVRHYTKHCDYDLLKFRFHYHIYFNLWKITLYIYICMANLEISDVLERIISIWVYLVDYYIFPTPNFPRVHQSVVMWPYFNPSSHIS